MLSIRRMMMGDIDNMKLENKKLIELPSDMNLSEILTEYPIPLEYESCLVILSCHGNNVATHGTQTRSIIMFYVSQNKPLYLISGYVNNLMSANEALNYGGLTWTSSNGSYIGVSDNKICATSLTAKTYYFAGGNLLYYTCIPYDFKLGDYII